MLKRRIAAALMGVLFSGAAFAANLPLLSGPQYSEPSQILGTVNTLIQNINSGVTGLLGVIGTNQVTTGTTIQTLGTITLNAGQLSNVGSVVTAKCFGSGTSTGTNTMTVQVGTATAFAVAGGATTAGVFQVDVTIIKTGASTQNILSSGSFNTTGTTPVITAATQTDTSPIAITCSGTSTTSAQFTMNGFYANQLK